MSEEVKIKIQEDPDQPDDRSQIANDGIKIAVKAISDAQAGLTDTMTMAWDPSTPAKFRNNLAGSADAHKSSIRANISTIDAIETVDKSREEEKKRADEMTELSTIEPVTGLLNRHGLTLEFVKLVEQSARDHQNLSILMVDLDRFKPVNDTHGHPAGDQVLRQIGRRIKANVRIGDAVSRYGGDEYLVLMPDQDKKTTESKETEIREAIEGPIKLDKSEIEVTVGASFGSITLNPWEVKAIADKTRDIRKLIAATEKAENIPESVKKETIDSYQDTIERILADTIEEADSGMYLDKALRKVKLPANQVADRR